MKKLSPSNRTIRALWMWAMLFKIEKERYISRALLNYDVVFDTFQDIKDYLKNFFMRIIVLYNCKYFNEY